MYPFTIQAVLTKESNKSNNSRLISIEKDKTQLNSTIMDETQFNNLFERYNGNLLSYLVMRLSNNNATKTTFEKFIEMSNNSIFKVNLNISKKEYDEFNRVFVDLTNEELLYNLIRLHAQKDSFVINEGNLHKTKAKIKGKGTFYTPELITNKICVQTIDDIEQDKIIDLGCGTGNFLLSCIKNSSNKWSTLNNIYGVEIDPIARAITILRISKEFPGQEEQVRSILNSKIITANAIFGFSQNNPNRFDNVFNDVMKMGGFDSVVMNPPYKVLKVNSSDFKAKKIDSSSYLSEIHLSEKERVSYENTYIKNSGEFPLSSTGMINYYRTFLEIALKVTKPNGKIGAIIPASLLGDISAAKLRKTILLQHNLKNIEYFKESSRLFNNVAQALIILTIEKGKPTNNIQVTLNNKITETHEININEIKEAFDNYEIPLVNKIGWQIIKKLSKMPKLIDVAGIQNRRGEFDLTLDKKYETDEDTGLPLIRGKTLFENEQTNFVKKAFLDKLSIEKKMATTNERLAGLQISNIDSKQRLKFKKVNKNVILGNSCNYLTSTNKQIDLGVLELLLNSKLLNWRFKITSTNSHINNYEISQLPINPMISKVTVCSDDLICESYGLSEQETKYLTDFYETFV